jgi:sarcosine oxidase subunit beta
VRDDSGDSRVNAPLPARAETVIVGGGIVGLAIAYNLAKRGHTDVVVLEAGYLASGASGRNGGGIRQQWSNELNIRLMQESVSICQHFAQELGINVWLRQGGYLFLARTARERARIEANASLQNRCGVPTQILTPAQARDVVPELEVSGFCAAAYNPTDGILFPWPFLWGYAQGLTKLGGRLYTFTRVRAIDRRADSADRFVVRTDRGDVACARVIDAAGAWSPTVAAMIGVTLPDVPVRHEIFSSEPLKPFLKPMVSVLGSGLYFSQSMRGEIVGGITMPDEAHTVDTTSTLRFVAHMARALIEVVPRFGQLKIVRQWAGPYDVTPDGNPILGEPPDVPGFYLCCGFGGHGFMMAPVMGVLYAKMLLGQERHEIFDRWRLARFHEGNTEKEDFVIG